MVVDGRVRTKVLLSFCVNLREQARVHAYAIMSESPVKIPRITTRVFQIPEPPPQTPGMIARAARSIPRGGADSSQVVSQTHQEWSVEDHQLHHSDHNL